MTCPRVRVRRVHVPPVRTARVLLADDEAERERGEGDAERQPAERVVGRAPHAARTARTASSPGFCGIDSATAAMPHCARAASIDAGTMPDRALQPVRGGETPAQEGARPVSGSCELARRRRRRSTARRPRPRGRRPARDRPAGRASPSTVGVESNRPRGASGAEVIASVPPAACSRTAPSPSARARPAKVRASAAARASEKSSRCGIRPKLPSERRGAQPAVPDRRP